MQLMVVTAASSSPGPTAKRPTHQPSAVQQREQTSGQPQHECSCLNWKEAYRSKSAVCGEGQELASFASNEEVSLDLALPFVQSEYCGDFFERLDHSRCVNLQPSTSEGMQRHKTWCYVSPLCQQLNEGARIPHVGASWKTCRAHKDSLLRDLSLPELSAVAIAGELDLGLLVGFAYPVQPQRWPDVEQFWWFDSGAEQPESVRAAMATRSPVIFEVLPDGSGDKVVAIGEQLWAVNLDSARYPRTRFGHECMLGCDKQNAVEARRMRAAALFREPEAEGIPKASTSHTCQCLNWKDAYTSGAASCGQGLENLPVSSTSDVMGNRLAIQTDICTDFYEKLDHNHCVKLDLDLRRERRSDQWCYVSAECGSLNGGAAIRGRAVSWKVCSEDDTSAAHQGDSSDAQGNAQTMSQEESPKGSPWTSPGASSYEMSPWTGDPAVDQIQTFGKFGLEVPRNSGQQPMVGRLDAAVPDYLQALDLNMQHSVLRNPSLRGALLSNPNVPQRDRISKGSTPLQAVGPGEAGTGPAPSQASVLSPVGTALPDSSIASQNSALSPVDTLSDSLSQRWCQGWCLKSQAALHRMTIPIAVLIMLLTAAWWLNSFAAAPPWSQSSQRLVSRAGSTACKPNKWLDVVQRVTHWHAESDEEPPLAKRLRSPAADRSMFETPLSRFSPNLSGSPSLPLPTRVSGTPPSTCYPSPSFCMPPIAAALSPSASDEASQMSPGASFSSDLSHRTGGTFSPALSSICSPYASCRSTAPGRPLPPLHPSSSSSSPSFPSELPLSQIPSVGTLLLPVPRRAARLPADPPPLPELPTVVPSGLLQRMPDLHMKTFASTGISSPGRQGLCTPSSGSIAPEYGASPRSRCSKSVELPISTISPATGRRSLLVGPAPPCQRSGLGQSTLSSVL